MDRDDKPVLHVVFGSSAAGTIRQALRQMGCNERVVSFPDDLSFGPIDTSDGSLRAKWMEDHIPYEYEDVGRMADIFWADVTSPNVVTVAWVCRNHASEHAGFLEFVWRMADVPFQVIEPTDVKASRWPPRTPGVWSLGILTAAQIVESDLRNKEVTLSHSDKEKCLTQWRLLKAENAPFRVVDQNGLISAPITHFDDVILSRATDEWTPATRIIGEAMGELIDRPFSQCPGNMIIWSRMLALGEAGQLVVRGTGSMSGHQVRRAAPGL